MIDGLDLGIKAVENTEELSEDAAGVSPSSRAPRQHVGFVLDRQEHRVNIVHHRAGTGLVSCDVTPHGDQLRAVAPPCQPSCKWWIGRD